MEQIINNLQTASTGPGNGKSSYFVPAAIVIAGILIAGAVVFSNQKNLTGNNGTGEKEQTTSSFFDNTKEITAALKGKLRPVSDQDHIRGNPKAPVTLVEFSDFQCPYCSRFHATMKQALAAFPNQVRWVYRHFPLVELHSQATPAALASECIAEQKGSEAFWQFADQVFADQQKIGPDLYREIAKKLGLNLDNFNQCFDQQKYLDKVKADAKEAVEVGGQGTPHNIVIAPNGQFLPFNGALPFEKTRPNEVGLKDIIEQALKQK